MRKRNIAMWLGGAVLLCVIASCPAPAQAQSIGLQQVTGTEVSASVSSNVRAEVGAGVEGGGSGSTSFSGRGRGRGSAALRSAITPANSGTPASHRPRGTASALKIKDFAAKNVKENGRPAASRLAMMNHAPAARAGMKSTFASPNPGAVHGAVTQPVSYSGDFPDSTQGTALISPFDPGTMGPFAFKPGLNATLPGFSNRQFLEPTLHVKGGPGGKRTGRSARNRGLASVGSQSGSSSSSISDDLGASVSTSVHQQ